MATGMDFVVQKNELRESRIEDAPADPGSLRSGEVLLKVDKFALTANNITYAVFGDAMRYWHFFPAKEGWGRVPVWGFGDVVASKADDVPVGARAYGYFPMSTHLTVTPGKITERGFTDIAPHRSPLPPVYNQYSLVSTDPNHRAEHEDAIMLFRPLFTTSFLIDDFLDDSGFFGAKKIILSSASSKTSLGLAFLLHENRKGKCTVAGLTSPSNVSFVEDLGCYDEVVTYDAIESMDAGEPVVFVDMAGNGTVLNTLHHHYKDNMKYSCLVGGTHWESRSGASRENLPGPEPTLFFAPDYVVKRNKDWTPAGFQQRVDQAWDQFLGPAQKWIHVENARGPQQVQKAYRHVLDGNAKPDEGYILSLWD